MKFKDFIQNPKELIGKTVLYESGLSYSATRLSLLKITKATKTSFKIATKDQYNFSMIDGHQKGLSGKMNMGTISICKILTEDEVNEFRNMWKNERLEKELRVKMAEKLKTMNFEQLQKMNEL